MDSVLITGGSGSLGKQLIHYFLSKNISKIKIISRNEYKQYHLKKEINDSRVRFYIGNVRDKDRLIKAMQGVDTVIHTAALKHIDICNNDPEECIKTNILGVMNVIDSALENGVKQVINISSDKAVNPINIYGASKQTAECIITNANVYSTGKTSMSSIRCGNFAGSSGSIIPLYLNLVKEGAKKLPLTHPDMIRYYMQWKDVFELLEYALSDMKGGEIYVKKLPLFKPLNLIKILGKEPEIIGCRNCEKLYEDMIIETENVIENGQFYKIIPQVEWYKKEKTKNINYNSKTGRELSEKELREKLQEIQIFSDPDNINIANYWIDTMIKRREGIINA